MRNDDTGAGRAKRSPATKLPSPRIPRGSDCRTERSSTLSSPPSRPTSTPRTPAWRPCEPRPSGSGRHTPTSAPGGTHQARLERDIAWNVTQRRLADLDIGDAPLDVRPPRHGRPLALVRRAARGRGRGAHAARRRLAGARSRSRSTGRRRSRRWTSCAAATSSPRRAASSSASTTRCSTRRAIDEAGLPIAGEGALLAALERNRTGRMGDIVATIQAEQDEAIRADLPGVARRRGRTGHRQDRGRAAPRRVPPLHATAAGSGAQGVLLVGPSPVFLRYIEHVLPSLGEQDVQLSTISGLQPEPEDPRRPTRAAAARAEGRRARMAQRHRARGRRSRTAARATTSRCSSTACSYACARRETGAPHRRRAPPARHAQRAAPEPRATLRRHPGRALQGRRDSRRTTGASEDAPVGERARASSIATPLDASVAGALGTRRGAARRLGAGAAGADAEPARGEGSTRAHVAGALGRRARQRPVRVLGARAVGRGRTCSPTTSRRCCTEPRAPRHHQRSHGPKTTSRSSTRPTRCSARSRRRARGAGADAESRRRRSTARRRVIDELGLHGFTDAASVVRPQRASRAPNGSERIGEGPAHVRARARRRGPGPHRDAVAHARPPVPVGLDDARRRPGSGQPARRARLLGRRARARSPARSGPRSSRLTINYRTPSEVMEVASRLLAVAAPDRRAVALGAQHRRATALRRRRRRIDCSTRRPRTPAPRCDGPARSR